MDDKWRKEAIGKRIRSTREELQMSQKDLSKVTGIKDSMISDFERGVREPSTANLAKIAHALYSTMDELYFGDESNKMLQTANYGMKIVNCFTELMLDEVIGKIEEDNEEYRPIGEYYIPLWSDAWAIKRLLNHVYEFKQNQNTYPNPDLYLDQIKQSVANEINKNHTEKQPKTPLNLDEVPF
jgi:Predicted transcriptional regulator